MQTRWAGCENELTSRVKGDRLQPLSKGNLHELSLRLNNTCMTTSNSLKNGGGELSDVLVGFPSIFPQECEALCQLHKNAHLLGATSSGVLEYKVQQGSSPFQFACHKRWCHVE